MKSKNNSTNGIILKSSFFCHLITDICILGHKQFLLDLLHGISPLPENSIFLDVGCGDGDDIEFVRGNFTGMNYQFIGIDPSNELIEISGQKHQNIIFKTGVIENLPFEDNSIDIVISKFIFHHLESDAKEKGISEIYRILKPKGHFIYIDFGKPDTIYSVIITNLITRWCEHIGSQVNNEVLKLMGKYGFSIDTLVKKTAGSGRIYCINAVK